MFNPQMFENSRPDGFPVLEILSPEMPEAVGRAFVPLKHTLVRGEIAGPLAALQLTQVFGYTREQLEKTIEAVYRFPLPGDAAVTGVRVRFGDVEIVAELKARQQAETEYQEAVQQGRQAALTTRESPDVFTLRVAGLQPDQDVTVETAYVQIARAEGVNWTLRIPLTTSPRYVRADEAGSHHAEGQPLGLARDPGHRFGLDVIYAQTGDVTSSTHGLNVQDLGGNLKRVQLHDGDVLPDRDCVLSWRAVQEAAQPGLNVLLHDDAASGYIYFLAQVAPPKTQAGSTTVPREVVLLVDHSGSMEGAKWEAADWAVKQFLHNLTERDSFALGLFHTTTRWFSHGGLAGTAPHNAGAKGVENAIKFLEDHKDSGGTELGVALEQALNLRRTVGECARPVLIVTDAEVTDSGRLLRLAESEAAKPDRRRISVLCIDAAPNAFLANELAERGGGIAKFLTSSPQEEDITTALDAVLEDFGQPVLANLRLEVDRANVEASGRNTLPGRSGDTRAIDLGDLPRGRAVWVAGRVKRGDKPELNFTVTVGGRSVASFRANAVQSASQRPALKALFGARRVLALEYLLTARYDQTELIGQLARLGYDATTVLAGPPQNAVYAENAVSQPGDAIKQLLVKESLEYGLACSETAFIAQRTEKGKPVEGTVAVANALPAGWSNTFVVGVMQPSAVHSNACYSMITPLSFSLRSEMAKLSGGSGSMYKSAPPSMASQNAAMPFDFASAEESYVDMEINQPPSQVRKVMASMDSMAQEQEAEITLPDSPAPYQSMPGQSHPAASASATYKPGKQAALFMGIPAFVSGQAVLFDTTRPEDADRLPPAVTFTRLEARFPDNLPDPGTISPDLLLLLYVDDMAQPRARVRLVDLLRQGGTRPLNVQRNAGSSVRITLVDESGNTPALAPMEVTLRW